MAEKNHQVRQMVDIYNIARSVIARLGCHHTKVEAWMLSMPDLGVRLETDSTYRSIFRAPGLISIRANNPTAV